MTDHEQHEQHEALRGLINSALAGVCILAAIALITVRFF